MAEVLIGREQELAAIAGALARAHTGQGQVVWLEGEAGCGKTSLLERAVALAQAEPTAGCHIWWVTGDLSELVIEHGISSQLQLLADAGMAAETTVGDETAAGYANHLLGRIRDLTINTTLLLVVDDLHWCDHSSLDVLRQILRRFQNQRVLVLLAHRPMDHWADEVRRSLPPMTCQLLTVAGLSEEDTRALAAAHGLPLTQRTARRLHAHTQGNAQLLTAVLDEVGSAELTSGEGPIPAPGSFADWVGSVFADLTDDERAVVAVVSILDGPASVAEIAAVSASNRSRAPLTAPRISTCCAECCVMAIG